MSEPTKRPDADEPASLDHTYENEIIKIEGDRYRVVDLHEGDRHRYQLTVEYVGWRDDG
jgi:hypothetical protein